MLMDAGSECGHHVYLGMCQNQKKQGGAPIQIRQRGLLAITFGFMLDIYLELLWFIRQLRTGGATSFDGNPYFLGVRQGRRVSSPFLIE
jgi:hypothetical protein